MKSSCPQFLLAILLLLCGFTPAWARIFDGGVDPANLGKGEWLWQMANCTNKLKGQVPSVTSVPTLMSFFKSAGIQFIIVKAGTGATNFPSATNKQFNVALVNAAHAVGIKIFGYTRSYGSDILGESAIADYVYNCGADGFVLDAEAEWESSRPWIGTNGPTLAWQLCERIKTNWPTKFLGHAPMPIISYHASFPYKEFGYWCDAVMPQDYWGYFDKTPTATVDWMDNEWRAFQNGLTGKWTNAIKPLAPIGQADNASQSAATVTEFFNYLKIDPNCVTATGYKGCSFWDAEEHYASTWPAIAAGTIGDVYTPPVITTQPQGKTLVVGETATFSVSVSGLPLPGYQWRFNGTSINGATGSIYSRPNLQFGDAGSYSVVVSNFLGSVSSSNALLVVGTNPIAPVIVSSPQNQIVIAGNACTLAPEVSGTTPLFYQWHFNGTALSGATNSTFTIPYARLADSGSYSFAVTNRAGAASSSPAVITVRFSLSATTSPGGSVNVNPNRITYAPDAPVTLTATANPGYIFTEWGGDASGSSNPLSLTMTTNKNITAIFLTTSPITDTFVIESRSGGSNFNWYNDGLFSDSTLKSKASGCSSSTLGSRYGYSSSCTITLTPTLPRAGGLYLLETTHGAASSVSSTIMVKATIQGGVFTNVNGTTSTSLWTSAFQQSSPDSWKTVGKVLLHPAVTQPVFRFSSTNTDFNQSTRRFYSDAYRLSFQPVLPQITSQPTSQTVLVGRPALFTVGAKGTAPLSYQWQFNGANLPNARGSALSLDSTGVGNAGSYRVVLSNTFGSATSQAAILTLIDPRPRIAKPSLNPGGFQFEIHGGANGSNYWLQATSDFFDWITLSNVQLSGSVFQFTDSDTNAALRFYRLEMQP